MNMNKFMTTMAKAGVLYIGAFAIWKLGMTWEKFGTFLGHLLAATITICAWLIIIALTLKIIWFILFGILL